MMLLREESWGMLPIPQLITGVSLRPGIPRRVALQRSSSPLPQPSPVLPERLNQSIIIQPMGVFNTADCLTFGVHRIVLKASFSVKGLGSSGTENRYTGRIPRINPTREL